mmetsp:Transcript_32093/g.44759  ORF Transcript_32093/g.44759 Transcript_32093/m.44759 type:complete len:83 (-) Transcript_32093:1624-1872(-)
MKCDAKNLMFHNTISNMSMSFHLHLHLQAVRQLYTPGWYILISSTFFIHCIRILPHNYDSLKNIRHRNIIICGEFRSLSVGK